MLLLSNRVLPAGEFWWGGWMSVLVCGVGVLMGGVGGWATRRNNNGSVEVCGRIVVGIKTGCLVLPCILLYSQGRGQGSPILEMLCL